MVDVVGLAGDHVVDAGHPGAGVDEPGAHMRTEKAGPAENDRVLAFELSQLPERRLAQVE